MTPLTDPPTPRIRHTPSWLRRPPLRWLTLTLVQDDPGRFDPSFWLDFIKRAHCDAASWNAGGYTAFYPTTLAHHDRNAAMGDTDPFGGLVRGCRELGIVVTARLDHHVTREATARAEPQWIARDVRGGMRRHPSMPELYLTCPLGRYNEDFMTAVMAEVMTRYRVDGTNHNRWAGWGMCYCDFCTQRFRDFCGEELPRNADGGDEGWRNFRMLDPLNPITGLYLRWRSDRLLWLWDHWSRTLASINPESCPLPGMGSEIHRIDQVGVRQRARALYLDRQGRAGASPIWMPAKLGKELRAFLGDRPAGLVVGVGLETAQRWKDSVQPEAELRLWVAEGVANGLHPKLAKFAGVLHDARWVAPVEAIYRRLHRWEPYLRNVESLARAAILHSPRTLRQRQQHDADPAAMGMHQAMLEARIPTEVVHEDLLEPARLDRFAVILLPDVTCLSDEQCDRLRTYVARGGALVATFETSLCDQDGVRRQRFGLADVFGVDAAGPAIGPMQNAYLRIESGRTVGRARRTIRGLEDAGRIMFGERAIPTWSRDVFEPPPVTCIPPYPDLPMEEVFPRRAQTQEAGIYLRRFGRGRVAYVPWDLDAIFWKVQHPDHALLLRNLVEWAVDEPSSVIVEGPGLLDVTLWRQADSLAVHLVHLNNPMAMRGICRELLPSGEQSVRVRLPARSRVAGVRLLAADQPVDYTVEDDWLRVAVRAVVDHEIVAIDIDDWGDKESRA
jgi:hypothetical protein